MRRSINVLLVDDNEADLELTADTLQESPLRITVDRAGDGAEALRQLEGRAASTTPLPDLILLDLNMPRMDGPTFLGHLRSAARFAIIPVVVLSSSDAERDVLRSYEAGANAYITKPVELTQFQTAVRTIERFWLSVAELP